MIGSLPIGQHPLLEADTRACGDVVDRNLNQFLAFIPEAAMHEVAPLVVGYFDDAINR
jgi:hypothetical protein